MTVLASARLDRERRQIEAPVAWALARPDVRRVQATIRPGHAASRRVASAAGLQPTATLLDDPDEGPVEIWQRAGVR